MTSHHSHRPDEGFFTQCPDESMPSRLLPPVAKSLSPSVTRHDIYSVALDGSLVRKTVPNKARALPVFSLLLSFSASIYVRSFTLDSRWLRVSVCLGPSPKFTSCSFGAHGCHYAIMRGAIEAMASPSRRAIHALMTKMMMAGGDAGRRMLPETAAPPPRRAHDDVGANSD